jgi:flagellar hook assembly protein FlgD
MYSVDQAGKIVSLIPSGTRVPTLFKYLHTSSGATAVLLDKEGNQRILGDIAFDDIVVVTSEDGNNINTYYLQFMEEGSGTDAYVLSSVLPVNQLALSISQIENTTTVIDLLALLVPAPNATIMIVDEDGNEVITGIVKNGYRVKVTSGNTLLEVYYELNVLNTSVVNLNLDGISAYPNPTTGKIFIVGMRDNSMIHVYNINGELVKLVKSEDLSMGTISIDDQPAGLYFITVNSGNYILKTLKVVKK